MQPKTVIEIKTLVNAPIEKIWQCWTSPEDIIKWNNASDDWHTPYAENDLRKGGRFKSRMEAKDGSMGFDFEGVYDDIVVDREINYTIADGRKVKIKFDTANDKTTITESFEAEEVNPIEMQRAGWQAILDNFKIYTEERHA